METTNIGFSSLFFYFYGPDHIVIGIGGACGSVRALIGFGWWVTLGG